MDVVEEFERGLAKVREGYASAFADAKDEHVLRAASTRFRRPNQGARAKSVALSANQLPVCEPSAQS